MACWGISLKFCSGETVQTCEACCNTDPVCKGYSISSTVVNVPEPGDILYADGSCVEPVTDGIYWDCPSCGTAWGCFTVTGGSGVIASIQACTGANSCGSGSGSECSSASTINTSTITEWYGRNKLDVATLDTWEDLYKPASFFRPDLSTDPITYLDMPLPGFYVKQIWIHNCYLGGTNDKRFSVRLFTESGRVQTLADGQLTSTITPVEMILADHMKVADGERIALLDEGSPLKLTATIDKIQVQANTEKDGWTISCWVEPLTQYYSDQPMGDPSYAK